MIVSECEYEESDTIHRQILMSISSLVVTNELQFLCLNPERTREREHREKNREGGGGDLSSGEQRT